MLDENGKMAMDTMQSYAVKARFLSYSHSMGGPFPLSVMPECGISPILISRIQYIPWQKFGMMNENCGNIELMQEISGMRMIVEMVQSELAPGARYGKRGKGR